MNNTFTIEDIHRVRHENYEATKAFSHKELLDYTKKETADIKKQLEAMKAKKHRVLA